MHSSYQITGSMDSEHCERSIWVAHPECQFILDANEGYNSEEAVEVLEKLHG